MLKVDQRRMSSSMYEVFNWGVNTEYSPKKTLSLSIAGSHINIDEPQSSSNIRRNQGEKGTYLSYMQIIGLHIHFAYIINETPYKKKSKLNFSCIL